MHEKVIVVVWASFSPRARTLAEELGGQVSFHYESRLERVWLKPLRWLMQGWTTWRMLEREQPDLVLVQTPPIFAPLVVSLWCWLQSRLMDRHVSYVIDGHTGAFHYPSWRWSLPLLRLLSRGAVATLVTDEAALHLLKRWQVRGFLLIDGLPRLQPAVSAIGTEGEARVAVISIFSPTEPICEILAAARLLPHVTFYLTGETGKLAPALREQVPTNVRLTGFLRGGCYTALLKNVDGLVVLSREAHDLSCGAFEALVAEQPAVVSNGPEMRRFFTQGFIHVENTPTAIADGVQFMLNERLRLKEQVIAQRTVLVNERRSTFTAFVALLAEQHLHPVSSLQVERD